MKSARLRLLRSNDFVAFVVLAFSSGCGPASDDTAATGGSGNTASGGTSVNGTGSGAAASGGNSGTGATASGGGDASGGSESGGASVTQCDSTKCLFDWPLQGEAAREWIIANYVDRTAGAGISDFHGGTRTYDGHKGVDIAIASFRQMDDGVVAHAVAPGIVNALHDGEDDRNTVADPGNCSLVANSVYVTHPDGKEGRYLHFKKGSLKVSVGQAIVAGDELGLVGSSGCSQSPHLHFELRDAPGGVVLDPFFDELWADPPAYDVSPGVMDVVLKTGSFSNVDDVATAPPTPASIANGTVGLSVISGGTLLGQTLQVRLYQGGVLKNTLGAYTYDGSEDLYLRWWSPSLAVGSWRADVSLGSSVARSVNFVVQ